MCVKTEVI